MSCIIEYRGKTNECYCNRLKECKDCNNKGNRKTEQKCMVTINGFCTCRSCGRAKRAN